MYNQLMIIDLPFSINAAYDVMSDPETGADLTAWDSQGMYAYLQTIDMSDFILTETFILDTLYEYGVVW
jgi:hypothetical protein